MAKNRKYFDLSGIANQLEQDRISSSTQVDVSNLTLPETDYKPSLSESELNQYFGDTPNANRPRNVLGTLQTRELNQYAPSPVFDPEGSGYDYDTAIKYGITPDETGHFPSRVPETGQLLKGRNHPTFNKTIEGEKNAGYEIYKGNDGRYYSKPIKSKIKPGEIAVMPEQTIIGERGKRPLSDITLTDREREIGRNIPLPPSLGSPESEEAIRARRLGDILGVVESPIKNVLNPIIEGEKQIATGIEQLGTEEQLPYQVQQQMDLQTPEGKVSPSELKSIGGGIRGLGNVAGGVVKTGLSSIPAVAALNAIQPTISASARKIGESIGVNPDTAEMIANKITPFVFGLPVGIGSLASEEATALLDKSGVLNDLNEEDKKLALDLVRNGLFFGIAALGGKGIEAGKEFAGKKAGQIAAKTYKPIAKEPTPDIQESNLTAEGLNYFKDRLNDPALSENERQITADYLRGQGINPEDLGFTATEKPTQIKGIIPEDLQNEIIPNAEKQTSDLPSLEEVQNAGGIRRDTGLLPQGGKVAEESQGIGGKNIQQATPEQAVERLPRSEREVEETPQVSSGLTVAKLNADKENLLPKIQGTIKRKVTEAGITGEQELQDILDAAEIELTDNAEQNWDSKVDDVINNTIDYYRGKIEPPTPELVNKAKEVLGKSFDDELQKYLDEPVNQSIIEHYGNKDFAKGMLVEQFARETVSGKLKPTAKQEPATIPETPTETAPDKAIPGKAPIDKQKKTLLLNVMRDYGTFPLNSPQLGEYSNTNMPTVEVFGRLKKLGLLPDVQEFNKKFNALPARNAQEEGESFELLARITLKEAEAINKPIEKTKETTPPENQIVDLTDILSEEPKGVSGNESAIQRMLSGNKKPEEISKALNVPIEEVNKFVQQTPAAPKVEQKSLEIQQTETPPKTEDTQAKELINNANHFDKTEKEILWRQWKRGVMNLDDIKKMTTFDIGTLLNDKGKINKWANAIINTKKGKGESKYQNAEEATFEEIQPIEKQPYEMTRKEFIAKKNEEDIQSSQIDDYIDSEILTKHRSVDEVAKDLKITPIEVDNRLANLLKDELADIDKYSPEEQHKTIIEQAHKEGKQVPENVLKDYPDLAEKYKVPDIPVVKKEKGASVNLPEEKPQTPEGKENLSIFNAYKKQLNDRQLKGEINSRKKNSLLYKKRIELGLSTPQIPPKASNIPIKEARPQDFEKPGEIFNHNEVPEIIKQLKQPIYEVRNWANESGNPEINYYGYDKKKALNELEDSDRVEGLERFEQDVNLFENTPKYNEEKLKELQNLYETLSEEKFGEMFPDKKSIADFIEHDFDPGDIPLEGRTLRPINETTDEILSDVQNKFGGKYPDVPIKFDKEGDPTEWMRIRIADHTGNYYSIGGDGERPDLSIVIANKDATLKRFGKSENEIPDEYRFDEDSSAEEIIDFINEKIEEKKNAVSSEEPTAKQFESKSQLPKTEPQKVADEIGSEIRTETTKETSQSQSSRTPAEGVQNIPTEKKVSSTQVNIPESEKKPFIDYANSIPEKELYSEIKNGVEEYGKETEPHVTALYGLKTTNPKDVEKVIKDYGDIELELGKTSLFKQDNYDVLKVDVKSDDLKAINKKLRDNLEYKSDFPDYKPHLTIAYLKPGEGKKYVGDTRFEGKKIKLSELLFSDPDYKKTPIKLSKVAPVPEKVTNVTTQLVGSKNLSAETIRSLSDNQKTVDRLFQLKESRKTGTPNEKRRTLRDIQKETKKLREQSIDAKFEDDNLYIDGQKIYQKEKPVLEKIEDVKIENKEAKTSFEKLPNEEVDKQTYLADVLGQKKFLPDDLKNMLPKGFGQSKIDKAVTDIKENDGAEQSKEAQILRDFSKEVENRFDTHGYIEFTNGQKYTKAEFKNDLEDFAIRRGKELGGETSFEFKKNEPSKTVVKTKAGEQPFLSSEMAKPVFRTDKGIAAGKGGEGTPLFEQPKGNKSQESLFGATFLPTDLRSLRDIKTNFAENTETVKQVLSEGATFIKEGFNKYGDWAKQMVKKFGIAIRRYLNSIWKKVKEFAGEIKTEFAQQLLNYAGKKGLITNLSEEGITGGPKGKTKIEEAALKTFESGKTRYLDWVWEMRKEFGPGQDYKKIYQSVRRTRLPEITESDMEKVVESTKPKETIEAEKATGLNKEEIESYRKELELDKLEPPKRKTVLRSLDEAKERNLKNSALVIADEIIKTRRLVDDAEHAGMVMKAKDLRDEYNSLTKEASELVDRGNINAFRKTEALREIILEQLDKLTMASDMGGTELGRALNIRKMRVKGEGYDLASVMQRAKAAKGSKLTEEETKQIKELTKQYEESEKALNKLKEDYDKVLAEKEKLLAQKVTEREARKIKISERASTSRERILKERADIKKQLTSLGFRLNDISGLTAEGSYWVGKLAVNYIKEGAINLNEVVQKVLVDLPDLTEKDVWKALNSRDPNRQAELRSEAQKRIAIIKTQARLLEDIKNAEQGIFKESTKKPSGTYEIYNLRKLLTTLRTEAFRSELDSKRLEKALQTINDLQDQLQNQYRNVKKKRPVDTPEIQSIKEKIKELRKTMNVEDVLADLQDQLRTGEFKIKEKVEVKPLPPELERKVIETNVLRKKIRNAIRELQPKTAKDVGIEVINTLRTAKASLDMSAALRQGFFPSVRRPKLFIETQQQAIKSFFSEQTYEQIQSSIESHPNHYLRLKSKLELTEIDAAPNKKEEMFQSQIVEKIPIYGTMGIKASNRHMVTTLNLLRVGIFDEFAEKYPNATQEELTAWANYINVATGRGDLGKFTQAANVLSLGLFSPRFAVSRFQAPFMIFKHWKQPRVRKEIAKDYAAFGALGATALTLAILAGLKVGSDPDDADFGKIVVGNTRVDMFAGIQQPTRLLLRLGKAGTDKIGLTEKASREENPLEMVGRFSSYKLAPSITMPLELITGKTLIGEDVTPGETALKAIVPMVYEDIYDAYMDGGITRTAWSGALNFFGMSTNTYEKKSGGSYRTIRSRPTSRSSNRNVRQQ